MSQLADSSLQEEKTQSRVRKHREVDPSRRYATLTFMRGSIISLGIALIAGLLGALYYIPGIAELMQKMGIQFTSLRPIHTTFAAAFIFLGGVAVVHRYFEDVAGPMKQGERIRLRVQVILWLIAGAGILVSVLAGVFSGREYMGFHPIFSVPIMAGWLLFAWNFFSHVGSGLFHRPVHATMWAVGVLFFIYTFVEQHAWMMPAMYADPIMDMRVQWKATGTLVGSFNLFVYASLYYIAIKISGSESYAHSRMAYALFGVGLLNSFTNFGHHTYHLPQNHMVKWISFVVSMTEIILLARVVWDIAAMLKAQKPNPPCAVQLFVNAAKWWTAFILATAILMSVPPINSLIHGTTVVMGHAMGAEVGIDGMILFAAITWILIERLQRTKIDPGFLSSKRFRRWIIGLNVAMLALVSWLTVSGIITAVTRYNGEAAPSWHKSVGPIIFVLFGAASAFFLGNLVNAWTKFLFIREKQSKNS